MATCECAKLDWTGCDMTAAHHPDCEQGQARSYNQHFSIPQASGPAVLKNATGTMFGHTYAQPNPAKDEFLISGKRLYELECAEQRLRSLECGQQNAKPSQ